jgi:uncharacterized protein involved in outer membrane biogenesis
MKRSTLLRRGLLWTAGVIGVLGVLTGVLAVALEAGYFRGPLIRFIASRAGRAIAVDGELHLRLFSLHPGLTADRVTIGNPSWMPAGTTAVFGRVTLSFTLPWIRPVRIEELALDSATLWLRRDDRGLANWQWTDPRTAGETGSPLVRRVLVPGAHVLLQDDTRHLLFDGTITVSERSEGGPPNLRLEGDGQLNGRAVRFGVDGEPLSAADHARPYRFSFTEQSSGTEVTGSGSLPRPFDFGSIDAQFAAAGDNLEDLYFLTGVKLLNTGPYRLSGKVERRATTTRFTELDITTGQSDARGRVWIDSSGARPKFDIELSSQRLRLADLGPRAAGREPDQGNRLLMSDAALNPGAWRRDDAVGTFRAHRLEVGRIPLLDVAATLTLAQGVVTVAPLTAQVFDGGLTAQIRADFSTDDPADHLDLKMTNVNLGKYLAQGADEPLLRGLLQARVLGEGHGRSLHEFAAGADGTVSAALPHGDIRASLAALAGLDVGALGLSAAKSGAVTPVRCAVAGFEARHGILTAQTLVLDTDPVLIAGKGTIHMDSEALDLALRGHPKRPGLRLRSPVLIHGTVLHPTFAVQPGAGAAAETAAAVALGVFLTPLASILAFVDPGLTKDADCGALLRAAGVRTGR